ncbi:MAG: hypothetical protein LW630_10740 [Saprospiraceae bacterium]|jgi:hypothetical protein|nr:hypothetical protein [Saprospiraceae bacterium]
MTTNKTKKEWILEAIERMDTGMLELLLSDEKTYFDINKEMFLEKLHLVFQSFRKQGDTMLIKYAGICDSKRCSNHGCTGYAFVGNQTEACMHWVVKETPDDIEDMFHCGGFKRFDENTVEGEYMYLDITEDEKVTYIPSEATLMMSHYCRVAVDEYLQYGDEIIFPDTYVSWLQKHKALFFTFKLPPFEYRDQNNFHNLYCKLRDDYKSFSSKSKIGEALDAFHALDLKDDISLMRWLFRYETLRFSIEINLYTQKAVYGKGIESYIFVHHRKISAIYYKLAAGFCQLHEDHYWDMYGRNSIFRRRVNKQIRRRE